MRRSFHAVIIALAAATALPVAVAAQHTTVIAPSGTISPPAGYKPVAPGDATFAELAGAEIFNVDGTKVAEISGVQGTHDGVVTLVVADIGTFLGQPARNVAFDPAQIIIVSNAEGAFRAYVGATHESLLTLPEYAPAATN